MSDGHRRLRINPDILSWPRGEGLGSAAGLADKSYFKYHFLLVMVPSEGRVDVHVPPRLCRCPFKHLIFIFRAARLERRSPGNQEARLCRWLSNCFGQQ